MRRDPRAAEVEKLVAEHHPGSETRLRLAQAFLSRLPPDEPATPEVLYRRVTELSELVERRAGSTVVRAWNPPGATGTVLVVHADDAPFLFTSVGNEIRSHGYGVADALHPVIGVTRDAAGNLTEVVPARTATRRESIQRYELDRRLIAAELGALERAVRRVLAEVTSAVADFGPMKDRVSAMMEIVRAAALPLGVEEAEVDEYCAFLEWIRNGNFVFLGYREYRLVEVGGRPSIVVVPGSGLGILADVEHSRYRRPVPLDELPAGLAARYRHGDALVVSKAGSMTTVQRWDRMDYVGARMVDEVGHTVGEARLLGLFSTKALLEPSFRVPILRRKFEEIIRAEDIIEGSHDHRAVIQLFDGLPMPDLFAARPDDLRDELMGLLALGERQEVRLFVRPDAYERRFSVLVALPRDRFNAVLRKEIQALLVERLGGTSSDYHLTLGEGAEAFLHFTVWVEAVREVRLDELERDVLELVRGWEDRVLAALARTMGEDAAARVVGRWVHRLPEYYRDYTDPEVAAADLTNLERLVTDGVPFVVGAHNESGPTSDGRLLTRVTLYRVGGKRPLSDLVPPLEDHGLRVVEEIPTRLEGSGDIFIHDFGVVGADGHRLDVAECGARLEDALAAVWGGGSVTDALSALVVVGGLDHGEVEVLRAYRTYWRRVRPVYTVGYIDSILVGRPHLTATLAALFRATFDPSAGGADASALRVAAVAACDAIPTFDEDRVFRAFLQLIDATVRTNAFVPGRGALALKLRSSDVPDMPEPVPYREIFVLGPTVEGVHLRGGGVSRGGIRWSDRREDYRTEVLGLMKAQMRKNVLIVPTGAKGGFVLRRPPSEPESLGPDVAAAYAAFVGALLEVTDNRVDGGIVHPPGVRGLDGDDSYLVVAADRGTGGFSDLANAIAVRRRYWLGDAFASGGSSGYDHKALGITARGAWVALDDHLAELGLAESDEITMVGIGDMTGDVFGNGLLASRRIRLLAAFDHRHVFVDPDPDPDVSHQERARLFALPGSSWADYRRDRLSAGGGVWARTEKRITLSPEARRALGVEVASLTADELVRAVLAAPVDVLWNGGIGTFVKARSESHRDVEDRGNDAVRVDAVDLRCRIVVEGGNLGLTQPARIEYAGGGGLVNTDFIDNSGGVDCSDREVNLKILLDLAVADGVIDRARRDDLVASASDEVVAAVLADSARQVRALTREAAAARRRVDAHIELMASLEDEGILMRAVDGLPTAGALADRARAGSGLTRPELAILLADAKRSLEAALLRTTLPGEDALAGSVASAFPPSVVAMAGDLPARHPLRRELVATIVANDVVDSEGPTFLRLLCQETGADAAQAVWAYRAARAATGTEDRRAALAGAAVGGDLARSLHERVERVLAAVARWYVAHRVDAGAAEDLVAARRQSDQCLAMVGGPEEWRARREGEAVAFAAAGLPAPLARDLAYLPVLSFVPDVVDVAVNRGRPVPEVLEMFVAAGWALGLDALTEVLAAESEGRWERWALHTVEDEIGAVRRHLVEEVLALHGEDPDPVAAFLSGRSHRLARLVRFRRTLGKIPPGDVDRLVVALAQLRAVVESSEP